MTLIKVLCPHYIKNLNYQGGYFNISALQLSKEKYQCNQLELLTSTPYTNLPSSPLAGLILGSVHIPDTLTTITWVRGIGSPRSA